MSGFSRAAAELRDRCHDLRPILRNFLGPVLDVLGALLGIKTRKDCFDHFEIVEVPGGHMVYWDAYEETADALERFLDAG